MLSLFIRVGPFLLQDKPFGIGGSERRAEPKGRQQGTGRVAAPGGAAAGTGAGRGTAPGPQRHCWEGAALPPPRPRMRTWRGQLSAPRWGCAGPWPPSWTSTRIPCTAPSPCSRAAPAWASRTPVRVRRGLPCAAGPPVCGSSGCCAACKRCVTVCVTRLRLVFSTACCGKCLETGSTWFLARQSANAGQPSETAMLFVCGRLWPGVLRGAKAGAGVACACVVTR